MLSLFSSWLALHLHKASPLLSDSGHFPGSLASGTNSRAAVGDQGATPSLPRKTFSIGSRGQQLSQVPPPRVLGRRRDWDTFRTRLCQKSLGAATSCGVQVVSPGQPGQRQNSGAYKDLLQAHSSKETGLGSPASRRAASAALLSDDLFDNTRGCSCKLPS